MHIARNILAQILRDLQLPNVVFPPLAGKLVSNPRGFVGKSDLHDLSEAFVTLILACYHFCCCHFATIFFFNAPLPLPFQKRKKKTLPLDMGLVEKT